jgi:hypothetical protein
MTGRLLTNGPRSRTSRVIWMELPRSTRSGVVSWYVPSPRRSDSDPVEPDNACPDGVGVAEGLAADVGGVAEGVGCPVVAVAVGTVVGDGATVDVGVLGIGMAAGVGDGVAVA